MLQGWLNYYAVPTSSRSLGAFRRQLERLWLRELRRRSQKDRFAWRRLSKICDQLWPPVRILHPWPDMLPIKLIPQSRSSKFPTLQGRLFSLSGDSFHSVLGGLGLITAQTVAVAGNVQHHAAVQ